jgi:polyisoprenyl-teichoic acid--peptidoglycan teichoic acid transferase
VPDRTRRRERNRRRAKKRRTHAVPAEPVTKWFDSDAVPGDGEARPGGGEAGDKSDHRGHIPPEAFARVAPAERARPGRHRLKERRLRIRRRPGPREAAQRRQHRAARVRTAKRMGAAAAAATVVAVVVWWQLQPEPSRPAARSDATAPAPAGSTSTLFVGSDSAGGPASWLALVSYDSKAHRGAVMYVPAHTAVEVPGRGLQPLGNALESGDPALLMVSAESLLGLDIDHFVEVTSAGARALFDRVGPISVDVPDEVRLSAGGDSARLLFTPGTQELTPDEAVDFLYTVGLEGDDVDLGTRHLAFWDALLDEFHSTPAALGGAVVAAGDDLGPSDVEVSATGDLLESLAGLGGEDLTVMILPVHQVGVGGAELYEAESEEVETLIDETITSANPDPAEIEVQVLNGNGVPGIGEDVAKSLVGKGFRVALSGNASSFNHKTTEIVTYDGSPAGVAAAERARKLLGVGEVLVSAQEQGIVSVDLTIVVGKDYLRKR